MNNDKPFIGFCPLASGSKGNCLYLATEEVRILIDAGLSRKATIERLATLNVALSDIDAIFITHDHTDHILGLKLLAYKEKIPVFANLETAKGIQKVFGRGAATFKIFTTGQTFSFGDLECTPFSIPHDTLDPVAFRIQTPTHTLGIAADIGFVTPLIRAHLQACDLLYLEANHDPAWVLASKRPQSYKERVLSKTGHISNQECGELLCSIAHSNLQKVYLAHLSEECNHPEKAKLTVQAHLEKQGFTIPLEIAHQKLVSAPTTFDLFSHAATLT